MARLNAFLSMLSHYKYFIVVILGVLLVGVLDDNSIIKRVQLSLHIDDLKSEIKKYNMQNEKDKQQLRDLKTNSKTVEKIARERYFMKADNEDIYVLSDDEQPTKVNDETAK